MTSFFFRATEKGTEMTDNIKAEDGFEAAATDESFRQAYCDNIVDDFRDNFVAKLRDDDNLWTTWAAAGFQVLIGRAGMQLAQFQVIPAKPDVPLRIGQYL